MYAKKEATSPKGLLKFPRECSYAAVALLLLCSVCVSYLILSLPPPGLRDRKGRWLLHTQNIDDDGKHWVHTHRRRKSEKSWKFGLLRPKTSCSKDFEGFSSTNWLQKLPIMAIDEIPMIMKCFTPNTYMIKETSFIRNWHGMKSLCKELKRPG